MNMEIFGGWMYIGHIHLFMVHVMINTNANVGFSSCKKPAKVEEDKINFFLKLEKFGWILF